MNAQLFKGQLVRLTAERENDARVMEKWYEDADYLRNVDTDIAMPKSTRQLSEEINTNNCVFEFRLRPLTDDQLIGFVAIHSIEWNNRSGQLAIGIGEEKYRNKGYGTDAMKLILCYAFDELNLERVGLDVIAYNKRAIHAYEKIGFKHEGKLRDAVIRDGGKYDRLMMGILRVEWGKNK